MYIKRGIILAIVDRSLKYKIPVLICGFPKAARDNNLEEFRELRPGPGLRGKPDVLVYYDTRPEEDQPNDTSTLKQSKNGSLSRKLPGI